MLLNSAYEALKEIKSNETIREPKEQKQARPEEPTISQEEQARRLQVVRLRQERQEQEARVNKQKNIDSRRMSRMGQDNLKLFNGDESLFVKRYFIKSWFAIIHSVSLRQLELLQLLVQI